MWLLRGVPSFVSSCLLIFFPSFCPLISHFSRVTYLPQPPNYLHPRGAESRGVGLLISLQTLGHLVSRGREPPRQLGRFGWENVGFLVFCLYDVFVFVCIDCYVFCVVLGGVILCFVWGVKAIFGVSHRNDFHEQYHGMVFRRNTSSRQFSLFRPNMNKRIQ